MIAVLAQSAFDNLDGQLLARRWSSRPRAVMVFFLTAPLGVGYVEHKVLAHMQARSGRWRRGGSTGGRSSWPTA